MSKALSIAVAAVCLATTAQGANGITLNPAAITIQYQLGSATLPAVQTLQVQTSPTGLNFTVAVSGAPFNASWLLVSASSGKSPTSIKVEANPTGLPAGSYAGTITVTATIGVAPVVQTAAVTLLVASAAPSISATPAVLNFSYTTGTPIPSPSLTSTSTLSSSGSALSGTVTVTGAPWLKVSPSGNISLIGLFNTISVTVDPTGLSPKVYSGQITINAPAAANKTLSLSVTLTVYAAMPTAIATWPAGVIQGSGPSIVTINGSGFFSNSTVAATGFTPEASITVTEGATSVTATFLIPVYTAAATGLRLAMSSPLPSGVVNTAYSVPLVGAGGTGADTFAAIAGSLPPGLSIVGSNISGTPTSAGSYLFTVQVTDSATPPVQAYSRVKLTIYPAGAAGLQITVAAAPLGLGTVGAAYGPVTLSATSGTGGPYTWSATNLPAGLVLSSGGVLSGTPSTDGSAGAIAANIVSNTALLATVPGAALASAGVLRMAVTTPAPGGGTSNEAQFQVFGPGPQIAAVVNSASYQQGTIAPGDLTAIFGLGLGPPALTIFDSSTPPIPTALPLVAPSTSVTINGTPAPVLYTSATQVGVIVPYNLAGPSAQVIASFGGVASPAFTVAVAAADPGLYSIASSGQGQGAILNFNPATNDYTINSGTNPAPRGGTIVIYMTGAGSTTSLVYDQLIAPGPAVTPLLQPTVTIGGQSATVLAAQAPPGSVPGLMQLNVTVPATTVLGVAVPVVVTIGGVPSQAGLTMAVR